VDLERIYWVPIESDRKWSSGNEVQFSGRLSWLERKLQSEECKRTIERNNLGTPVRLVELELGKEMVIRLCDEKFKEIKGTSGQLRLLIRGGGIVNDWSIKPIFAMVIISQFPEHNGEIMAGANIRVLQRREEFDKWNQVIDATNEEMNKKHEQEKQQKDTKKVEKTKSTLKRTSSKS
jgi:hypothetical protein